MPNKIVELSALRVRCVVGRLLKAQGYSLQANAKVIEGNQSPDRNAQFEHINAVVTKALARGQPVISVDTKKKELVVSSRTPGRMAARGRA